MQPNPLIIRSYSARGARLWIATRAFVSLMVALSGANPLSLSIWVSVEIVMLSVVVCLIDTWRHHERALLANLAVSPSTLLALFAVPASAGELVLLAIGAVFT